ncbi:hypothetical protein DPMN_022607 [Dreissena polymorpha]|uniref:Uncharacterized protein n=1 Tax=Dreissena polymorpha TaxID=45954 RepID=A0A9D4SBU4_DREPO|nr:hypothetical protein DPMN_022607 [Dreissena polymorpha]
MDATTKFSSNVTLINVTEQETFNATSSNVSGWEPYSIGSYYRDTKVLLWRVIAPILFSIGTIGNALTIIVLLRQKKMTSTAVSCLLWRFPIRSCCSAHFRQNGCFGPGALISGR